jgi:TPR repeat protein
VTLAVVLASCSTTKVAPPPVAAPARTVAGEPPPTLGEQEIEAYFAPAVEGCQRADAAACGRLARRLTRLTNDREGRRVAATLSRACAMKVPIACAGEALAIAEGLGRTAEPGRGLVLLRQICEAGEGFACAELAEAYMGNDLGAVDKQEEGRRLADESCKRFGGWACMSAAAALNPETDGARVLELLLRASDGGDEAACYSLGMVFSDGELNVKADPGKATDLYKRGCDGDFAPACFNLAWQHLNGAGTAKDERTANALLERSCQLADPSGCDEIARRSGDRRRACERWGAESCYDLAVEIAHARGETAETAEELISLAERGCRRHHQPSCRAMEHLAKDNERWCTAGEQVKDSCTFSGIARANDAEKPSLTPEERAISRAKAADALTRACNQGSTPACSARARLSQPAAAPSPPP